ncbi:MAG: MFS transporter, partial [Myxococcota bacterium]
MNRDSTTADAFGPPNHPDAPEPGPGTSWSRAWAFVPTLYFIQGLPYVIVNNVTVVLYKTLGISNSTITVWTSWLGLAWAFKAFWSPFVDGVSTKRRWTVSMQLAMAPVLVLVAFSLPLPWFFPASLTLFFVLAFLSATHDIAADGLYMVGLDESQQSAFVGVRSTEWRLAPLIGEPALIYAA